MDDRGREIKRVAVRRRTHTCFFDTRLRFSYLTVPKGSLGVEMSPGPDSEQAEKINHPEEDS
jgi:hypothetical protein